MLSLSNGAVPLARIVNNNGTESGEVMLVFGLAILVLPGMLQGDTNSFQDEGDCNHNETCPNFRRQEHQQCSQEYQNDAYGSSLAGIFQHGGCVMTEMTKKG